MNFSLYRACICVISWKLVLLVSVWVSASTMKPRKKEIKSIKKISENNIPLCTDIIKTKERRYNIQKQAPEVFYQKRCFRIFAKFTGKHLWQSLLFNKGAGLRPLAEVFSCEFCEISKNTFCYRTPPVAASKYLT